LIATIFPERWVGTRATIGMASSVTIFYTGLLSLELSEKSSTQN